MIILQYYPRTVFLVLWPHCIGKKFVIDSMLSFISVACETAGVVRGKPFCYNEMAMGNGRRTVYAGRSRGRGKGM